MSQLTDILVVAGSAATVIGVPILVQLVLRVYDEHAKLLESRSFKKVSDELEALRKIRDLHEVQLVTQLVEVEEKGKSIRVALASGHVTSHVEAIQSFRENMGRMMFVYGTEQADMFYDELFGLLEGVGTRVTAERFRWKFLGEYEDSLLAQVGLEKKPD